MRALIRMRELDRQISKSAYTGIVSAFCEKVKSAGYTPMVYASTSYFTNYLEENIFQMRIVYGVRHIQIHRTL